MGLAGILNGLPQNDDANLLVGFATKDDAGIYRINDDTALVVTADFITPPVDDPFVFGRIAADNAISDVYAMGGRPITCLSLAGFPAAKLPLEILQQIMEGASQVIKEAGAVLAGGHTVEDEEPKFGLAVNGIVHPQKFWQNCGARPGDDLILTKPIGSGVLFNANQKGWVSPQAMNACIQILSTLNRTTAEVCRRFTVHAATDVTGFGLAGHAFEIAQGSDAQLAIQIDALPIMAEALEMYERGMRTGVNAEIRRLVNSHILFTRQLPGWHEEILFDPQTSGGLLLSVPSEQTNEMLNALKAAGVTTAVRIGRVHSYDGHHFLKII